MTAIVEAELGKADTEHASQELADRIARHMKDDGRFEVVPGLFLYRSSSPSAPGYGLDEPSLCVIAQGSKEVLLGQERFRYDASRYLLVASGLPIVSRIVEASNERPYLALRLVLDPSVVTPVLMEAGLAASRESETVKAVAVSRLDGNLVEAVLRLVRLLEAPKDYEVLAPLAVREIIYRLARGDQAARLRQITFIGAQVHRLTRAIQLLREHYDKPLSVPALAKQLGMSVSSFHHHFKAATAMSPLQFQKQVRLQTARQLLLAGRLDAATAGYRVGYGDQSQFNREYKRLFGEPPMRDVRRLRLAATGGNEAAASAGAV
jgi:AraC-like DNA-binding protein